MRRRRTRRNAGLDAGTPASPTLIALEAPAGTGEVWPVAEVVRTGASERVNDLACGFGPLPGGPWPEPAETALYCRCRGQAARVRMECSSQASAPAGALDSEYRAFLENVTGNIRAALAHAEAYEEERKRAEALAEIDRAKTAFFSNVSHEFRTPLTLMLGPLEEMLSKKSGLPAGLTDLLSVAHRNGLRLQKLVNSLLDFSRIEAGRVEASYEPVELASVTAELASTFRSAIEKAGLQLIVECPRSPAGLRGQGNVGKGGAESALQCVQVHIGGPITVRVDEQGEFARLAVADTGTGIAEQELPHLFERFHRVEGARGRTQEGTGIGLALVAELVKLHSGTVEVRERGRAGKHLHGFGALRNGAHSTRAPGCGSRPQLHGAARRLLCGGGGAVAARGARPSSHGTDERSSARVLVVDDNADMRDYVGRLLLEQYDVETAANGDAALEIALAIHRTWC